MIDIGDSEMRSSLLYAQVIMLYFRNDLEGLISRFNAEQSFLRENLLLSLLIKARIEILKEKPQPEFVEKSLKEFSEDTLWKAEILFLLGFLFYASRNFLKAQSYYQQAAQIYFKNGAYRKSLRSEMSALSAFSCHHPQSRLFVDYYSLHERSLSIGENLTAATCLVNISREFQLIGGLQPALDYINQALELFNKDMFGSREHGLGLLHRADIYLSQNDKSRSLKDLYHAALITHSDVQSACRILCEKQAIDLTTLKSSKIMPTWEERKNLDIETKALSSLEEKLIHFLSQGPKDKYEIMTHLYGDSIDLESLENRLKNLLSRIRANRKNLLQLHQGKYQLNEDVEKDLSNKLKKALS